MPEDHPNNLARKISHLFETIRRPDGKRFSDEDVSRSVSDAGESISPNYVYLLRTGRRDNPTKRHLEALARFFGVPPAYFFDEALEEQIREELALLAAMRESGVRDVALRAAELNPRSLRSVLAIIQELRGLEDGEERSPNA